MGSQSSKSRKTCDANPSTNIQEQEANLSDFSDQQPNNSLQHKLRTLNMTMKIQASKQIFELNEKEALSQKLFKNKTQKHDLQHQNQSSLSQTRLSKLKTAPYKINPQMMEETTKKQTESAVTEQLSEQTARWNTIKATIREQDVQNYYQKILCFYKALNHQQYKVKCRQTGQLRLMRVIPKVTFDQTQLIKGQTQIGILQSMCHPNIVRYYQSFQDITSYYIILECVRGRSLKATIQKKQLKQQQINYIARTLLHVLEHMHTKGVMFRDLCPQNIKIIQNKHHKHGFDIKLVDFKKAIWTPCQGNKMVSGNVFYRPPEASKGIFNHKYDIWSVGMIVLFLFAGQRNTNMVQTGKKQSQPNKLSISSRKLHLTPLPAKLFLYQLLQRKYKKRPQAKTALKLQWLSGVPSNPNNKIKEATLDVQILQRCGIKF